MSMRSTGGLLDASISHLSKMIFGLDVIGGLPAKRIGGMPYAASFLPPDLHCSLSPRRAAGSGISSSAHRDRVNLANASCRRSITVLHCA